MKTKHLLLAVIPLAAVWIYAISQSAESLYALLEAVPAQESETARAADGVAARKDDADARPELRSPAVASPAVASPVAAASSPRPAIAAPITPAAEPPRYPEPSYASFGEAVPLEHPEVTDPAMRKLLQPAWDD
jgi:hypothetical protein